MTGLAKAERSALCDVALQVGEDQPTLSGEWTVKDLVVHLLLRESGNPAAVGILVPPLAKVTDAASRRLARRDFAVLVEKLRNGPPRLSPFSLPKVDGLANALEFFVHHEDIRRAQPTWSPRTLDADAEKQIWSMVPMPGKGLTRKSPVGVTIENATTGSTKVLNSASPSVTVKGLPSEVTLYLFGRKEQARVELLGDADAVGRLSDTSLGL
jgi:uncharacterized protein (TIGR03085 family)